METEYPIVEVNPILEVARHGNLEQFVAVLRELVAKRRENLFYAGDLINERIKTGQKTSMEFWRHLAGELGCSSSFVRLLQRVSATYPEEVRERYPDAPWSWFAACLRADDPIAALEKHVGESTQKVTEQYSPNGHKWVIWCEDTPASWNGMTRGKVRVGRKEWIDVVVTSAPKDNENTG